MSQKEPRYRLKEGTIDHRDWNALVRFLARSRILGVRREKAAPFWHPWQIAAAWSPLREAWTARVNPGYVNGEEVEVRLPGRIAPVETLERLEATAATESVKAWLSEEPSITLPADRFREIGPESGTVEPVPVFFQKMGVLQSIENVSGEQLRGRRILRAVDIVLRIPRTRASVEFVADGDVIRLEVDFLPAEGAPFLLVEKDFQPPEDPLAEEIASGGWVDRSSHDLQIGTVYLVSAAGAKPGARIDETWSAYSSHRRFWNLTHAVRLPVEQLEPIPLPAPGLGLGLGVADRILQGLAGFINQGTAQAEKLLAAVRVDSRVWV